MRRDLTTEKTDLVPVLAIVLLISLFGLHRPDYLNLSDPYFWIGLITLPLSYGIRKGAMSRRLLWPTLFFGLLSIPFTTTFGIYCTLVFGVLYIVEQHLGKTSFLFALHLLLLSPLFQYLNNLVSFPIRLALSGAAGNMLAFAGFDIQVSGNLIQLDGQEFLVDSACAGLFMLRYSFLFAVIILAYLQDKQKSWKLTELAGFFTVQLLLCITGNLIRIVLLIVFKIMPEHWFHEVLGLIIFFVYSLLPFYWLTQYCARKKAPSRVPKEPKNISPAVKWPVLVALLLNFAFICYKNATKTPKPVSITASLPQNYQFEPINGIFKLQSDNALIYIKPPVEAYSSDHNPLICWKGSGYDFRHIREIMLGSVNVSVAELVKGDEKLYTMWWFDSGTHRTGSQWDWRWRSLAHQEGFYLVNITTATFDQLVPAAQNFMELSLNAKAQKTAIPL